MFFDLKKQEKKCVWGASPRRYLYSCHRRGREGVFVLVSSYVNADQLTYCKTCSALLKGLVCLHVVELTVLTWVSCGTC